MAVMIQNKVPDCLGEDDERERLDRGLRRQQDDHRRSRHVEDVGVDCKSDDDKGRHPLGNITKLWRINPFNNFWGPLRGLGFLFPNENVRIENSDKS